MKIIIVKRHPNHPEPYDERKLYASIYASCLSVRAPVGEAELTAERVCKDLLPWIQKKSEITSKDIRAHASSHLTVYNPHAAYMYKHHGTLN
jgi:transcriptional regulator NrdR family protein